MRNVIACVLLSSAVIPGAERARAPITLVMQFEGVRSDESVDAMRREFSQIMRDSGRAFEFMLRSDLARETPAELILVRFKGRCRMEVLPSSLTDDGAPYATTHVSDGEVLSFVEVACDRVRMSIRPDMNGDQLRRGQAVYGRALGRVLAHEVYHVLGRTRHHGARGIAKAALSAGELLAENLEFANQDLDRIRDAGM